MTLSRDFNTDFENASQAVLAIAPDAQPEQIQALTQQLQAVALSAPESPLTSVPAPAAPPAPLQTLNIKDCMELPGIYVYHVRCLVVKLENTEEWSVVKVDKAEANQTSKCINDRLTNESRDIMEWRGNPKPSITKDNNRDIVACFTGQTWTSEEKFIRERLGLPLGKGKSLSPSYKENERALKKMNDDKANNFPLCMNGKLKAMGWQMYLYPEDRDLNDGKSIGPSELIMMPTKAMQVLRHKFRDNPAEFACGKNNFRCRPIGF